MNLDIKTDSSLGMDWKTEKHIDSCFSKDSGQSGEPPVDDLSIYTILLEPPVDDLSPGECPGNQPSVKSDPDRIWCRFGCPRMHELLTSSRGHGLRGIATSRATKPHYCTTPKMSGECLDNKSSEQELKFVYDLLPV